MMTTVTQLLQSINKLNNYSFKIKNMNYPFIPFDPKITDVSILPTTSGNYLIALRHSCNLPATTIEPYCSPYEYNGITYDIIYTGMARRFKKKALSKKK